MKMFKKKFFVCVKAGAKSEKIEQIDEYRFLVWTKEPAKEDRANKSVIKLLAKFLRVLPSQVILKKGRHFQEKVFKIE